MEEYTMKYMYEHGAGRRLLRHMRENHIQNAAFVITMQMDGGGPYRTSAFFNYGKSRKRGCKLFGRVTTYSHIPRDNKMMLNAMTQNM